MKFAGPSMGAALGSGLMQGFSSARETVAKEELDRDKSAMGTYSKLVQSGEWEPVGKEGAQDGGVLRVGNIGLLKKVRGSGSNYKELEAFNRMKNRDSMTSVAQQRFKLAQEKPGVMMTVENPETRDRKNLPSGSAIPSGYYKVGTVNAPIMEAQQERTETGRVLGVAEKELQNAEKEVSKNEKLANILAEAAKDGDPTAIGIVEKYKKAVVRREQARKAVDKALGQGKKTPFESPVETDRQLPFEVPQKALDAAEEMWLKKNYSPEVVNQYMRNYDQYQEYIKSGTISKKELLEGLKRLMKFADPEVVDSRRVPFK